MVVMSCTRVVPSAVVYMYVTTCHSHSAQAQIVLVCGLKSSFTHAYMETCWVSVLSLLPLNSIEINNEI